MRKDHPLKKKLSFQNNILIISQIIHTS